jgi:zinc/manganese transport system substrate-binding protein
MLAPVVRQLVGNAADVTVLMPNGADPHQWSPSGRDIEAIAHADLVIANGLGLEANLQDPLRQAHDNGVRIFSATDHVTVRRVREGEASDSEDPDQVAGASDPHLWTDPITMKQWIDPLVDALRSIGVDADASGREVSAQLGTLDTEVATILQSVPAARRKLVTGHESLGYLAARYHYKLVGAAVSSLSSQAGASAGRMAALRRKIEAENVPAVFTELGSPRPMLQAIADDAHVTVVPLSTHLLPADGTYRTFMIDLATTIAGGLT